MKKLLFLGPKGTYSESAAIKMQQYLKEEYILTPISTISKTIDFVDKNDDYIAVLPIENLIEGIVRQTLDYIYLSDVKIMAELDINIEHSLISKGEKSFIKHILSHPQALSQCQKYITNNFDENIDLIDTQSTAFAYYSLKDKDNSYGAIVSPSIAKQAQQEGFKIKDFNIGDVKENKTRFILISKKPVLFNKETTSKRTSIAFNTKNKPGALLKVLQIIANDNLNLVYLESRPSKKVFAEYNFFADIDKSADDIKNTLIEIQKECNYYKLLGSYRVF